MSESGKYTALTRPYLNGNGVELGSGGWPVVPWAIQVELPADKFRVYNQREIPDTIEWQGDIFTLPFKDGVLDFVYSSHLIEDFSRPDWRRLFTEWGRCLKRGGNMVILVPEFVRWNEAIKRGQPPNCSHWAPEPMLGEVTQHALPCGFISVEERLTNLTPEDYTIMAVLRKA